MRRLALSALVFLAPLLSAYATAPTDLSAIKAGASRLTVAAASGQPVEDGDWEGLLQKPEEAGLVRVIVTLDVPDLPEGRAPTEEELEARRRAIAEQTRRLFARTEAYKITVARTYNLIPVVTLEVDGEALRVLRQAKEVVSISEDVAVPPLHGGDLISN